MIFWIKVALKGNFPLKAGQRNIRKDDLPLLLPKMLIKKCKVQKVKSIKYPGVLLEENLS